MINKRYVCLLAAIFAGFILGSISSAYVVASGTPPPNHAPNTPSTPSGPTSGYVDTSYTYSTSATDPDGDQVKYCFNWDDDTSSWTDFVESGSTSSASHSWASAGTYYVKAKAQDSEGTESGWSSSLAVTIEDQENATEFIIYPSADAFTNLRDNPSGNYGSESWIGVNRATKSGVWPSGLGEGTFLKFDLSGIPSGAEILSVTFHAYAYQIWYSTTCSSHLREFGTNWSESTITGNNAPWDTLGGAVSDTVQGSIPSWWGYDVDESYVRGKLGSEVGFYFCYPGTAGSTHYGQRYYSKEYADPAYRPYLKVTIDDEREIGVWWGEDYCWPTSDLEWSQEDAEGFYNTLVSEGFTGVFNYGDDDARQYHFEEEDYNYVDAIDFAWWTGHGDPGKIVLTEDPWFAPRTVDESEVEWGDVDLEWAILCGCKIVCESECTPSEWGNAFNELHGICGFHTKSKNSPYRGSKFAEYATGGVYPYEPLTIKESWMHATIETQPSDRWGSIYAGVHDNGIQLWNEYLPGYGTGMFSDPDYDDPSWYKVFVKWPCE